MGSDEMESRALRCPHSSSPDDDVSLLQRMGAEQGVELFVCDNGLLNGPLFGESCWPACSTACATQPSPTCSYQKSVYSLIKQIDRTGQETGSWSPAFECLLLMHVPANYHLLSNLGTEILSMHHAKCEEFLYSLRFLTAGSTPPGHCPGLNNIRMGIQGYESGYAPPLAARTSAGACLYMDDELDDDMGDGLGSSEQMGGVFDDCNGLLGSSPSTAAFWDDANMLY